MAKSTSTRRKASDNTASPDASDKSPAAPKGAATTPEPAAIRPPRFRDRIVELQRVKASELRANPKNWRRHPDEQIAAMTSMLDSIGMTGALIGRRTPDGIELLDGHMRQSIAGDELVPVLIVDLNDQEAELMLATFDPLSELALMDAGALRDLLEHAAPDDDNAFLRKMTPGQGLAGWSS